MEIEERADQVARKRGAALDRLTALGVDPIVSPDDCTVAIGVSRPTLHRMQKRGELPPFVEVSPGRKGWHLSVLQQAVAGRRDWSDAA